MKKMIKYLTMAFAFLAIASGVQAEELSVNEITSDGINVDSTAVDAGSDTVINSNNDRTFVYLASDTTVGSTVTITAQESQFNSRGFGTIDLNDITVNVANGDSFVMAPTAIYNNDQGRIEISYSGDTSALSVGVFERPSD